MPQPCPDVRLAKLASLQSFPNGRLEMLPPALQRVGGGAAQSDGQHPLRHGISGARLASGMLIMFELPAMVFVGFVIFILFA
jgi:hypothetical protein